ncbi:MAG: protein-export chaperone SecB, partial [Pseudolabrys sp.]
MTTTNGGPGQSGSAPEAGQDQPQLTVVAQYIKDFSFENPNAPQSLNAGQQQPQIGIQINVGVTPLSETDIEVVIKLDGKAETASTTLFRFELEFAGIFRVRNVPQ